ncbi:MAG TPA: hypothetical protein VME70_14355, partial [Mycobacteriales bacterium]|nr:hypothetical protein [Mycobacteriales bacterium]
MPGTTWHKQVLAHGVTMTSGSKHDSRGIVSMHVLKVNLAAKNIGLKPLVHSLAERSPLSTLAQGHPEEVAVTNTGYFDFRTGAPTQPLISQRSPLVISSAHQEVVGIGTNGRMEAGPVWWSALLTAGSRTHSVVAKNELDPPSGLAMYTPKWGSTPVPIGWRNNSEVRQVVDGVASKVSGNDWGVKVPSNG